MTARVACMLCMLLATPASADDSAAAADQLNRALLQAHNKERAEARLPPLSIDPRLTEAARRHARDMAEHESMTHQGSDGSQSVDRVRAAGCHYVRIGENVAEGRKSIDKVLEAWMGSPGHKANILGEFTQMGGARAVGASGRAYWCVDFGAPVLRLDPAKAAAAVVDRINAARKKAGLPPLKVDDGLAGAAREAAEAEARESEDSEQSASSERPDVVKLVQRAGVSYSKLSRYAASGAATAEDVVESMLKLEGGKGTALGGFRTVGVGYATGAEDRPFWFVLLVEP